MSLDISGVDEQVPGSHEKPGEVACRGIGSGRVHVVTEDEDFDTLPEDVVLVSRTSTPRLAAAIGRASAVLTDVGTATGHLAAIAREFRVPTILDTEIATRVLRDAGEVTVDAEENVVYAGRVGELLHYQLLRSSAYAETAEFRLLRRMLKSIAPLNLNDPQSPNFVPQKCVTCHDIIRFAHEKAVEQLTEGYWVRPSKAQPLRAPVDLGNPTRPHHHRPRRWPADPGRQSHGRTGGHHLGSTPRPG